MQVKRYRCDLNSVMLCADDGEWVLYEDVEALRARLGEVEAENERLRNEINARKGDPVTRLHNICAGIGDMQKDSPFGQEAWDAQDEQNRELQKQLTLASQEAERLQKSINYWEATAKRNREEADIYLSERDLARQELAALQKLVRENIFGQGKLKGELR